MWLYMLFAVVVVLIAAGLLGGGIFTIVFIPLAVIIAGAVAVFSMWSRGHERGNVPSERERVEPLPTSHTNAPAAPATPDQAVDARQRAQ